jgi:hypothetical protein
VFARDQRSSYSATSGPNGYGIPYQVVLVPQSGASIPTLNSTATNGNYGGIIVLSEVSYGYPDGTWHGALTADQWNQLHDYQIAFSVWMVRIDVYPDRDFGKLDSGSLTETMPTSTQEQSRQSLAKVVAVQVLNS